MCGIAGYVGPQELPDARLDRCLQTMRRRGPDAARWKRWQLAGGCHAALLNARLSIIDRTERANQPFRVGKKAMTFNGEIYNYVELRDELRAAGRCFSTASDTEVFLAAIDEWGDRAWDRLEGMWAAAIFDEERETLTLSRDRFGEKPLFLFTDESGVYFGSEPKSVAALLGRSLDVNVRQVRRFLVNGYRSLYKSDETFFDSLQELKPGTWARIRPGDAVAETTYWKPSIEHDEEMTRKEAIDGVRSYVVRAVELRLRADAPLAFCLSGGIDSNAIAAIASRICGFDVHGFTSVDQDPRYDERDMAAAAAADLGIRHTAVPTGRCGFIDTLKALVVYHDAPVYTITSVAQALLMKAIAGEGYRVVVSGTAADEILSGYYDHHLAFLATIADSPAHAAARTSWQQRVRPFVRNPFLGDPDLFVRAPLFRDHLYFGAAGYAEFLVEPSQEPFEEHEYGTDLLRNRMLNELQHETVPVILHEDDANAMYWSIENRSPYLDRHLVDFCQSIPTRHLIQDGFGKSLLREAMHGIVPAFILDNPRKVGFNAPIGSFLDTTDPGVCGWLLGDSPVYSIVKREKIAELIRRSALPNSDSKFLFSFVSSKMFLEEFAA